MKRGKTSPESLLRPSVRALHGYPPGEHPKVRGLVKLNTNENPYPPAPAVLRAIRKAADDRLRLYPDPTSQPLRAKLAEVHGCAAGNVFVGNGSDEVLAYLVRAFVEPEASVGPRGISRATVQYPWPAYSLYPVLAGIHGAHANAVPLAADFGLPSVAALKRGKRWDFDAALTFVTTPNAPSGRGYTTAELEALCVAQRGAVVLDEAYAEFADEDARALAFRHPNVIVTRTFSKAYSLCGQRVGYCLAHPGVIAALDKLRDSYNVNRLGQVAALATLGNPAYYRKNFARIRATREQLRRELSGLGWQVLPSQTNFLLARPPGAPASEWLGWLRDKRFLVRWFPAPEVRAYLRITVGSEREAAALLRAVRRGPRNG
jgi:histidinol-phosphate aminotransferase